MVKKEQNRLADLAAEPQHLVTDNPLSSTLIIFGAGIGLGLMMSSLLTDPIRHMVTPETSTEKMRRQLMEALQGVLPESLMRR